MLESFDDGALVFGADGRVLAIDRNDAQGVSSVWTVEGASVEDHGMSAAAAPPSAVGPAVALAACATATPVAVTP